MRNDRKVLLCLLFLLFLISFRAFALITLTPVNGGSISPSVPPSNTLLNQAANIPITQNYIFYYFVNPGGTAPAVASPSINFFTPLDITLGVDRDPSLSNMIEIEVKVTNLSLNPLGTQQPVVTILVSGSANTGTAPQLAPIAAVNGIACSSGSGCQGSYNNRYYAAKLFSQGNSTLRIGIYPDDICATYGQPQQPGLTPVFGGGGGYALGCTGNTITRPSAGNPTQMQLTFAVNMAPDSNFSTFPPVNTVDKMPAPVRLSFQVDTPTFSCPSDMSSVYISPGDGQVTLNSDLFTFSAPNSSLDAPPANFVVIGNEAAPPISGSSFRSSNSLIQFVSWGGSQNIGGFKNSLGLTDGLDHPYQLTFMLQDQTGMFVAPSNSCILQNVRAAPIEGFFNSEAKSKCFIATATYQSENEWPVILLRKFRDKVLLKTSLGQEFVSWYYQWSPSAAEWVSAHPGVRLVLLFLLTFVEIFALILLNKIYLILAMSGSLIIGVYLIVIHFIENQKKSQESG